MRCVASNIECLADVLNGTNKRERRKKAIAVLSQLVGTLVLSRALVDADPDLADEILKDGRRQLLLDLVEHGVSREIAYRAVQAHAMRAWKEGLDFKQLVLADKEITSKVPRKQIELAFDLPRQLQNVDKIFARVFGGGGHRKNAQTKPGRTSQGKTKLRQRKRRS